MYQSTNWIHVLKRNVITETAQFLIIKPTRCINFSYLFLGWNSTCFGQFLCPLPGTFHCTHSNGICHTRLLTACEHDQDGTGLVLLLVGIDQLVSRPTDQRILEVEIGSTRSYSCGEIDLEEAMDLSQNRLWGVEIYDSKTSFYLKIYTFTF